MQFIKLTSYFILCGLLLAGCSAGERVMVVKNVNPNTGETEQTTYSREFSKHAILIPETIDVIMQMQLEPKDYTPEYHLRKAMGALGPDDLSEKGHLSALFRNMTNQEQQFRLLKMSSPWKQHLHEAVDVQLLPNEIVKINMGSLITSTYATNLKVDLEIEHQGHVGNGQMVLNRLTTEDVVKTITYLADKRTQREETHDPAGHSVSPQQPMSDIK